MYLTEIKELLKAYKQVMSYQRKVIEILTEAIGLSTANTKLSPSDAFVINFVATVLQEPENKDSYKNDPYVHTHGIC